MKGELAFFDQRLAGKPSRDFADEDSFEDLASPHGTLRPNIEVLIGAISTAAASLTSKDQTIRNLEARLDEFEDLFGRMKDKLNELLQMQRSTSVFAKAETQRADKAEECVKALSVRAQNLEEDLDAALMDLQRIAEAMAASNFIPRQRGR